LVCTATTISIPFRRKNYQIQADGAEPASPGR
jgi:hypothetical protein